MYYLQAITMRGANLYLRIIIYLHWLVELWNSMFIVRVIEKDDGHYVKIRNRLVRLEIYPATVSNGFLIGRSYYTHIKPSPIPTNRDDDDDQD